MCTKLLLHKDLVDPLMDSLQDEALLSEHPGETAGLTYPCTRDVTSRTQLYLGSTDPALCGKLQLACAELGLAQHLQAQK